MEKKDKKAVRKKAVAVIGGGASGCMAAIAAARAGANVHIFEKNDLLARKIYATGNGRCNLTNLFLDRSCYHAGQKENCPGQTVRTAYVKNVCPDQSEGDSLFKESNPDQTERASYAKEAALDRVLSMIGRFSQKALMQFFENEGVLFHDRDGYVYPRTDQAETIAKAFEKCIRRLSVEVHTCCEVKNIRQGDSQDGLFKVSFLEYNSKKDSFSAGIKTEKKTRKKTVIVQNVKEPQTKTIRTANGPQSKAVRIAGVPQSKTIRDRSGLQSNSIQKTDESPADVNLKTMLFDAVILSCGGLAGPSFGCSGDGYRFAGQFSHHINKPLPALTQLVCRNDFLKRAAGVRCQAMVMLLADASDLSSRSSSTDGVQKQPLPSSEGGPATSAIPNHVINKRKSDDSEVIGRQITILQSETGELQITDYGISGIPVFQLSSLAARLLDRGARVFVRIDFLPELTEEEFQKQLKWRLDQGRDQTLQDFFLGLAHKKIIDLLLACTGKQAEMKAKRFTDEELCRILRLFRGFTMEVISARSFENAQVTSGGIPLDEVDDGLQSLRCPGLFFSGELLDVDGRCGGYNLQWAMTSGMIAGTAAAKL